jgi:hypothetical protein
MGGIDLDPCSNSKTAPNVPAEQHYNRDNDGLSRLWHARVYLNPPYGAGIESWIDKLAAEVAAGRGREAITLVPGRTDTTWFRRRPTELICFNGRLRFSEHENAAPFPSAVAYIGLRPWRFVEAFEPIGKMFACFAPDWR